GAGASVLGIGSDSGGSIRLPAAWAGVCGLRPTAGRVPTTGHYPRVGPRSDGRTQIGPLAASVDGLELALSVMAGPDGRDMAVAPVPLPPSSGVELHGLRLAVALGEGPWQPVAPATAGSAPPHGEVGGAAFVFLLPTSLVGVPALAVPTGDDGAGLPIGAQLVGRAWAEHVLFAAGRE